MKYHSRNKKRHEERDLSLSIPGPWMSMLFGATPSQAAECLGRIMWEKQHGSHR